MTNYQSIRYCEKIDRIGILTTSICAIHCAITPFIAGFFSLLGIGSLVDERLEWALCCFSIVLGIFSLWPSFIRLHRRVLPGLLFTIGIVIIVGFRLSSEENFKLEVGSVVVGALLISTAHLLNRKYCRTCLHCSIDTH
ncbi:MAG: MerC domain-containing protein [Acidobacteriota bacterium]